MDLETRTECGNGPDAELWLPFPLGKRLRKQEVLVQVQERGSSSSRYLAVVAPHNSVCG